MTDISCLKTEVHLNTMYKLSPFHTESMLLVYYIDQSSAAVNNLLCGYEGHKKHVNIAFGHVVFF